MNTISFNCLDLVSVSSRMLAPFLISSLQPANRVATSPESWAGSAEESIHGSSAWRIYPKQRTVQVPLRRADSNLGCYSGRTVGEFGTQRKLRFRKQRLHYSVDSSAVPLPHAPEARLSSDIPNLHSKQKINATVSTGLKSKIDPVYIQG